MKLSLKQLASVLASYVDDNKISVDSFSVTRDNTVGLLDKVAKIFTIETNFVDKLAIFDGEDLSYGKIVEEWASDLILAEAFDPDGAGALSPHDSTYRPVFYSYTLGRKVIPQTIRNDDIERAVHNEAQFISIIEDKTRKMYDSETMLKYGIKREALGVLAEMCIAMQDASQVNAYGTTTAYSVNDLVKENGTATDVYIFVKPKTTTSMTWANAIANGYIIKLDLIETLAKPVDTSTGEAFIKALKGAKEVASDYSEGHSLNGNTLGATPEDGLVLVMLQGIQPSLEVDTMAGAFHEDKVALPVKEIVVPDFGSANSKVWAVLLDARGCKLHNTYRAVRENINGHGDFLNMFFHTENTVFLSRNVYVRVFKTA